MKNPLNYEAIYQRVEISNVLRAHDHNVYAFNGHYVPISKEEAIMMVRKLFAPIEQRFLRVNVIRQVLEGIATDPAFQIDFVDFHMSTPGFLSPKRRGNPYPWNGEIRWKRRARRPPRLRLR